MIRRLVALLLPLALVLTACAVPSDRKPRALSPNGVPFELLAPSDSAPSTTVPVESVPATVYFVGPQHLVAVTRSVPAPLSLGSVLATMVQGPTDTEVAQGLHSAIDAQTGVLSTLSNGSVASVNLSNSFSTIDLPSQIDALAQVVYTATELPGITSVQIMLDSQVVSVPRGNGSSTRAPLQRTDYPSFAP